MKSYTRNEIHKCGIVEVNVAVAQSCKPYKVWKLPLMRATDPVSWVVTGYRPLC